MHQNEIKDLMVWNLSMGFTFVLFFPRDLYLTPPPLSKNTSLYENKKHGLELTCK